MIISLAPGDVFRNVLENFRPSQTITITLKTEWDYGHVCQIDLENINHWKANHRMTFSHVMPQLNIANAGLNGNMEIEIRRQ